MGYKALLVGALLLTAAVIVLSAGIRLSQAGMGCSPWPECYGATGAAAEPAAWASAAHRAVAGVLGLVILALVLTARRARGASPALAVAALGVTLGLAMLGLWSGGRPLPGVVLGNLLGGFALLSLLWWQYLRLGARAASAWCGLAPGWAAGALLLLGLGIVLGGLTSAYFAGRACPGFPLCGETGAAGDAQAAIHLAHRGAALLGVVYLAVLCAVAWFRAPRARALALALLALASAEAVLGALAATHGVSLVGAAAHNALGAALLLGVLSLLARTAPHRAGAVTYAAPFSRRA